MKFFRRFLGINKFPEHKVEKHLAPSEDCHDISYRTGCVKIKSIDFQGEYKKSKSGEWAICWNESTGIYVLCSTTQNRVVQQGTLRRPNYGSVSNLGLFSIEDWSYRQSLESTFYVFSAAGEVVIKKPLKANMVNSAISPEGRFAVCQTANTPLEGDGNLFCAFDLINKIELFAVHPETWADSYGFIEEEPYFVVSIKGIGKFRYDKHGTFIDLDKYEKARLDSEEYNIVLFAAEDAIKSTDIDSARLEVILDAVLRARGLGADQDQHWKCRALKLQGTTLEKLGRLEEALDIYGVALRMNPKIGVKRKAEALRKKLGTKEDS